MYLFKLFVLILFYSSVRSYPTDFEWMDTDEDLSLNVTLLECELNCRPLSEPVQIKYYLYTRNNPEISDIISPTDLDSIKESHYNVKHPTRILSHGWTSDSEGDFNKLLVEAYLATGDFNVIVVEWSSCAKQINYFRARCCVENVGQQIAEFIDILNENFKLKYNNLVLIGHSLGAHVVGHAGKNVKNGKINTIVGLDPAKPCFVEDLIEERLSNSDAVYVETIHTNGGGLGFLTPVGHASFYPNWGKFQKSCLPFPISGCSHKLAYVYYAESIIENNFIATKCDNFDSLLNKDCSEETDIRMGGEPSNQNKRIEGIFFLETNKDVPFGMG